MSVVLGSILRPKIGRRKEGRGEGRREGRLKREKRKDNVVQDHSDEKTRSTASWWRKRSWTQLSVCSRSKPDSRGKEQIGILGWKMPKKKQNPPSRILAGAGPGYPAA